MMFCPRSEIVVVPVHGNAGQGTCRCKGERTACEELRGKKGWAFVGVFLATMLA
jgi:hypothetical protein